VPFEKGPALADPTMLYIVNSRPLHDRLQQILTQVAGFSLLVMTRGPGAPRLDGPLALAGDAFRSTREELGALHVPARAKHHYRHVIDAAGAVERSMGLLTDCLRPQADETTRAVLVRCLRLATDHLRAATRLLPGFEMVDLRQACCAAHPTSGRIVCA